MRDPLALLGLARRAGALAYGTGSTRRALKEGRARLILFAQDASDTQREKVMKLLRHGTTPRATLGTREALGSAVGSAPVSAVAVTDRGFAKELLARLGVKPGKPVQNGMRR
ncbi:MAG: ribosomal L7Ae/L30e/S12e/Gadd45 family protein [Gemmatimonadetes bacterium]|nr:ribosomal L7Ae/L30e/S12e/Gadd45 family protein [Gemmatimonadota bacterium]